MYNTAQVKICKTQSLDDTLSLRMKSNILRDGYLKSLYSPGQISMLNKFCGFGFNNKVPLSNYKSIGAVLYGMFGENKNTIGNLISGTSAREMSTRGKIVGYSDTFYDDTYYKYDNNDSITNKRMNKQRKMGVYYERK